MTRAPICPDWMDGANAIELVLIAVGASTIALSLLGLAVWVATALGSKAYRRRHLRRARAWLP